MMKNPFRILRPYADKIEVDFLVKADEVSTDAEIKKATGVKKLASLKQKHGKKVVVVRKATSRTKEADGIITNVKGLGLLIRFADCQSFVVYAPEKGVLGLIHAGWRGLVAGVIPEFFKVLKKEFDVDPSEVVVCAGPSLCYGCSDFTDPAKEVPELSAFFDGKFVDLISAADTQLNQIGLKREQVERMSACTRCNPGTMWSYRGGHKEEVQEGYTNCFVAVLR